MSVTIKIYTAAEIREQQNRYTPGWVDDKWDVCGIISEESGKVKIITNRSSYSIKMLNKMCNFSDIWDDSSEDKRRLIL